MTRRSCHSRKTIKPSYKPGPKIRAFFCRSPKRQTIGTGIGIRIQVR